jgi:hypothetical protein
MGFLRPGHLSLIFEKKKKKKSILKLIFAGYTGCKNSVQNRVKIQFVNLIFPT